MTKYETEKKYLVAEDESGYLYIYIKAKKDTPSSPKIIYDGCDHAIFVRSQDENIILDYINPQVRDKLRKAREVVVVETLLDNVKDAYIASMNIVDKIPLDWNKIGLKTWEEVAINHS